MHESRLKRLKNRLGQNGPGLTVAVIAMIVALSGGAFAATNSGSSEGQATASATGKQGPRGKQGKPGKPGAPGSAGAQGPAGPKGDTGAAGSDGKEGPPGKEGKEGEPGEDGEDGEDGPEGPEGSPWTVDGALPEGATETGNWAFSGTEADTEGISVPISFPIPLIESILEEHVPGEEHVHYGIAQEGGVFSDVGVCPAFTAQNPKAAPGELCIYQNEFGGLENATFVGSFRATVEGANRGGAVLRFTPTGVASGAGTFAVTGCVRAANEEECAVPAP